MIRLILFIVLIVAVVFIKYYFKKTVDNKPSVKEVSESIEKTSEPWILVTQASFDSNEEHHLVQSNIDSINAILQVNVPKEKINMEGFWSYYVDYYLAQTNNGGLSQFVYNSKWNLNLNEFIEKGLKAMGAKKHLALFERLTKQVESMGVERLKAYLTSEYWGDNEERDYLNQMNDEFFEINKQENIMTLNHNWLKQHPQIRVFPTQEDLDQYLQSIAQ